MRRKTLDQLETKAEILPITPSETRKLIEELRSVQESFDLLMNDGRFYPNNRDIIRRHFKRTVCE